jgi:hypothetical protein
MIDWRDIAVCGTEHSLQAALFCWASQNRAKWPELRWMFAIPNGGMRGKVTASRLKAEGVKKGVPDIFLPVAKGGFHGLFIEMKKRVNGRMSIEQKTFSEAMTRKGYMFACCNSTEKAIVVIEAYLSQPLTKTF